MKMIEKEDQLAILQRQLEQEEISQANAAKESANYQRLAAAAQRRAGMIKRQIEALKTTPATTSKITVSDHAIVRYLERAHGLDMDNVRTEMLDPKTTMSMAFLNGAKGKINANGLVYVVENNAVITVLPGDA